MYLLRSLAVVVLALTFCLTNGNTVCPGASLTVYGNGFLDCAKPVCVASGGRLSPSLDPTKYFVCAGPNISYEMRCAPGTCFSSTEQTCVHPYAWVDICHRPEPTTTTPEQTTTTSTTEEPTTTTTDPETTESTTTTTEEPTATPEPTTTTSTTKEPTTTKTDPETTESTTTTTEEPTTTPEPTTIPEPTTTTTTQTPSPRVPDEDNSRSVQLCPGSDPTTLTYGDQDCTGYVCSASLKASNLRKPHKDPLYFYFCFTEKVLGQERCPTGTCFDYGLQECVDPTVWRNYCSGL